MSARRVESENTLGITCCRYPPPQFISLPPGGCLMFANVRRVTHAIPCDEEIGDAPVLVPAFSGQQIRSPMSSVWTKPATMRSIKRCTTLRTW